MSDALPSGRIEIRPEVALGRLHAGPEWSFRPSSWRRLVTPIC